MPPLKGCSVHISGGFGEVIVALASGNKYRRTKRCIRKAVSLVQARANPAKQSDAAWEGEGKRDHCERGGG